MLWPFRAKSAARGTDAQKIANTVCRGLQRMTADCSVALSRREVHPTPQEDDPSPLYDVEERLLIAHFSMRRALLLLASLEVRDVAGHVAMRYVDGVTPGPERDSGTSDRKSELQWAFEHHGASRKSVRGGSRDSLVDRVNESKMLEAQMKDIYESQISSLHKAVAGAGAVSVLLGAGLVAMAMKK